MASQSPDNDDTIPNSKSPGNQGARGSRGDANSGALAGNSTEDGASERARRAKEPDLRKAEAEGGGGLSSESSRSTNKQP